MTSGPSFRHLPLAIGYVGAWSMPIKAPDGEVLGTFGTYFRERRTPTPRGAARASSGSPRRRGESPRRRLIATVLRIPGTCR
jgi:hypothetical protein